MSTWEWTSTGGDSLCDDMAGIHHGEEPARPHPNCVCDVVEISPTATDTYELGLIELSYESYGPGAYEATMHFRFGYTIRCADGTGQTGEVVIDRDYANWAASEGDDFENTDSLLDDVWSEAADHVESMAKQICPAKEAPLYS